MGRGHQIERQWRVLRCLEGARRGLTIEEIRDAIGESCHLRTIRRDVADLQAAGFPVVVDQDRRFSVLRSDAGGWSVPVDPSEVIALALTEELLSPLRGTALAEPLASLRARLNAMLTPQGRAYVAELKKTAVATLFGAVSYDDRGREVEAIQDAIARQHRLTIRYAAPGRIAEARTVDPYCTWYAGGRVYLVAFCHKAEDVRTFAVQRIEAAEVLDEAFDPDPAFDAAEYVRLSFGVYHGAVHRVVVDFDASVAHLVRERRYHVSQRVTERPDGVRLTMDAAGLPEIAAWVAGFGGKARPVAPKELVEAVRALHEDGLARLTGGVVTRAVTGGG